MEQKTNKIAQFKQWILSIVIFFFDLSLLGFLIIFTTFWIFGDTEMWSCQMYMEILGVSVGGTILILHGQNCR